MSRALDVEPLAAFADVVADPTAPAELLLRDLRARRTGLTGREAERRLLRFGRNELTRRHKRTWPGELAAQFTHPLALLLWAAGGLAFVAGTPVLGWTIFAVVVLNAAFAFAQERQAERAVEALSRYLPQRCVVLRDGAETLVDAPVIVPGDVVVLVEGERVPADARLLDGEVEVDLSLLTGESHRQLRTARPAPASVPLLAAPDLVFSGTTCTSGTAHAVVYATGDHTELGRIASLAQRVRRDASPLERQVKRVAWLIALVAVGVGVAFLPLGLLAGLTLTDAFLFAVGLLVANVPEGLLPTITLALATGVRGLAKRGAVVKRLSAVETLGSTNVICTDKTGTITENRMRPVALWLAGADAELALATGESAAARAMAEAMGLCTTVARALDGGLSGDPTELAVAEAAAALGLPVDPAARDAGRRRVYRFDRALRLMSTVDAGPRGAVLHVKGAPEVVLARCATVVRPDGSTGPLADATRMAAEQCLHEYGARGLRVLAVADRLLSDRPDGVVPEDRGEAERELRLLGMVALVDPPRPEVAEAVRRCHTARLRIHVVTGDNGDTATAIARQVGIGVPRLRLITGEQADAMSEEELARAFTDTDEVVCARSSPESKLRIADALRDAGQTVAMTGDGVNDAPALRRADIGVAMGRTGTDVAREASTMVLADDNFATIVAAVEAGRRVYDNVRKFIVYIFAHAVPEAVPFLVFALSGGAVPLPLTVLEILAIDLGTETLPALALGREPAEPGLMERPPRARGQSIVTRGMLMRAWGVLGCTSAVLVMAAFFFTLLRAGWRPGDATGSGSPLHQAYLQATTATFVGIVACQVGTALAARTERAALSDVGFFSNPMLLWGIAFELAFTAVLVYAPFARSVMHTAPPPPEVLAVIAPFPVLVWGIDELYRLRLRRRGT